MQYVLATEKHNEFIENAFRKRGFDGEESAAIARICSMATWHGIRTHAGLKSLELDRHFGSEVDPPGCVPGAALVKKPSRFSAAQRWVANRKSGPIVTFDAFNTAIALADKHGVGVVSVDDCFHYMWGGGYVMDAARRGYIAYTNCTSTLAEVVPFGGRTPTLGTNPQSWGLPTVDAVGFPIVIDWATSKIAMGRVVTARREDQTLPPDSAVDKDGQTTTDPHQVSALLPFGDHKGYGLSLINELTAALIGGGLPTSRGDAAKARAGEKTTCNFFIQVIHPEALDSGMFAEGRDQTTNLKAVIEDILGPGNEKSMLPGQIEHEAALRSEQAGGLIFSEAEVTEFEQAGRDMGLPFDRGALKQI
ncbi:MAG: lactate dehydrogenase [Phycisphaeraceae bacterium]|nr:lactate dehydrogenase [Phycisphaeraceae bacterium]